jgi:hypothetical protein
MSSRRRVIVEFETPVDARKVEESVKTGYVETSIENLVQWIAVEEDLSDTYGRLTAKTKDPASRETFRELKEGSERTISDLTKLLRSLEELDRARVNRIESLRDLGS